MPAAAKKSTSVRAIRTGLGVLDRVAPGLGALLVERIWFTVPARRSGGGDLPPGATPFEISVGRSTVRGRRWGSGDEIVYLVHGWGGSSAQLRAFIAPLRDAGFSIVAYDALSHGDSDPGPSGPRRATALEFADVLRAVVATHGPAHGVISHSLGSMVTAITMRDGIVPQRAVFVAPMADATSYTQTFTRMLGAGTRTWTRFIARLERRFDLALAHFDLPAIAGELATPPLLVIHDRDDQETRWEASGELVQAWPEAQLLSTTGLGHNRILTDPRVVAASVAFLSGQDIVGDRLEAAAIM